MRASARRSSPAEPIAEPICVPGSSMIDLPFVDSVTSVTLAMKSPHGGAVSDSGGGQRERCASDRVGDFFSTTTGFKPSDQAGVKNDRTNGEPQVSRCQALRSRSNSQSFRNLSK